ncbi:pyridoxal 5'-phosphate synthase glutaminase subunit PdxT [Clostridium uliginosum]|uniref:Pyridoxal 5'-phosphate synthase subunit PdxT n=1 Tax=Clostridium uliginosum TaxID=119641 RepID=A0A1I1H6J0_9CLOT|nr:pyridoxal 5'-phosphate synthase glutaminase subunit PdxT [Clostridium uliginosum]SFC19335.1 5'-phosphate synthase pdxT subunit [Clostridium uliginosum]
MNIGVLAFQGSVIEHIKHIEKLGHKAIEVKKVEDLNNIDALILPGGESTTIGKLLIITGMLDALRSKILSGLPVWGTCAGMILLAKEIEGEENTYLGVMDIKVKRNAYGTQIDSFESNKVIEKISPNPIKMVFIRAPYVIKCNKETEIISEVNNNIIAVRERNMLATSFHPELTDDTTFLEYFIKDFA